MTHLTFFIFIASLVIGFGAIILTNNLYQKYKHKYLKVFFYYLIFMNVGSLLNTVLRYLDNINVLDDIIQEHLVLVVLILSTLFIIGTIHYFLHIITIRLIVKNEISRKFRNITLLYIIITFLIMLVTDILSIVKKDMIYCMTFLNIEIYFLISFLIIIIYTLFLKLKDIYTKSKKNALKYMGIFYMTLYSIHLIVQASGFMGTDFYMFYFPFYYLILNAVPFFFIKKFLMNYHGNIISQTSTAEEIETVFKKFKITKREKEIIGLILKGKTNNEIEDELFISINTVKHHVYSIYTKLKVKNRGQLTSLLSKYQQ